MTQVEFDLDPAWYEQQVKLAKGGRPLGRSRINKDRERLLVGYIDGVLILAFPHFEVSTVAPGSGEGWFSLNPVRLAKLLATFSGVVRLTVDSSTIGVNRFRQTHGGVLLRPGSDDPDLNALADRIDEIAAEQCHRRLVAAAAKHEEIAVTLRWHRALGAANAAPLLERIRENALIVYRLPETPADAPSFRAVVERKQNTGDRVYLLCHDFKGNNITVDPRWLTHVGS